MDKDNLGCARILGIETCIQNWIRNWNGGGDVMGLGVKHYHGCVHLLRKLLSDPSG